MKIKFTLFVLVLFYSFFINAQSFTELPSMPVRVSNNAVTEGIVNGVPHVYSFAGIDSTKIYSGIHKKAFRYNTATQVWDQIADLPSGNGRIAAGASTVKNKIYIIGGYEVFSTGNEVSFDEVHIYDPETNTYLPNGTPIPVAIDDHVQAVYKDSLIFVVTGWSNTTNVPNVQIYNPSNDEWLVGTSTPNNNDYKVFGASGIIVGDTLYYAGGAGLGFNFPATDVFRKGYINPNDPTDITWEAETSLPEAKGYRMAVAESFNSIFWVGGSDVTYNFNGVAYNGSGGVFPKSTWTFYTPSFATVSTITNFPGSIPKIMDLRGIAKLDENNFVVAGGMEPGQSVTNRVFQYHLSASISNEDLTKSKIKIFPNPTSDIFVIKKEGDFEIQIFDTLGRLVFSKNKKGNKAVNVEMLPKGNYILKVFEKENLIGVEQLIKS